jgi:hypothetical protein
MIAQLLIGGVIGAGAILALGWWAGHREDKMIEAFLQEEEDTVIKMFELMLLGFEDESVTGFVVSSPVESGVVAMKMIIHQEDSDVIVYARADGLDVSLVSFQEWAAIASYEVVQAIPCIEDFDDFEDDDDWEAA